MIEIGLFREIHGHQYPQFADICTPDFYQDIHAVIDYLRSGEEIAVAAGYAKDIFTGERIPGDLIAYERDGYAWTSETIYYVEKCGLHLSEEFLGSIGIH